MNDLWTEKYRPTSPVTFQASPHLHQLLISNSNQHLLLYGPPGSGKTTFAHLLTKKSTNDAKANVLELNASDERGIAIVRQKIKSFASSSLKNKFIILDECDNLTSDAQQCLRRVIEDCDCRFIFITNYLSKIIAPLKSRLLKLKFENSLMAYKYLKDVGEKNEFNKLDEFYENLFKLANLDLRRALNVMQGIAPFINEVDKVDEFLGIIPEVIIDNFLKVNIKDSKKFVDMFIREGFSFLQLLSQLSKMRLTEEFRIEIGRLEEKAVVGCSSEIMLLELCCMKVEIFDKKK